MIRDLNSSHESSWFATQKSTDSLQFTLDAKLSEQKELAQTLQSTLETKLSEQQDQAQALQDEIASQGKTISIFTVLNLVFLPLSFFTQVNSNFSSLIWAPKLLLITAVFFN